MTNDYKRGWLRGIFDGEGGCYWYDNPTTAERRGTHHSHRIEVTNTDPTIAKQIIDYLTEMGIQCRVRTHPATSGKNVWRIGIQPGFSILRFHKMIGFSPGKKADTLERIVDYIDSSPTYLRHFLDPEVVRAAYLAGRSYRQLAKQFGYKNGDSVRVFLSSKFGNISRSHKENIKNRKRNELGYFVPQ